MRSTAALALASLAIACSFNADGLGSSSANLGTTSGGASATSTGEQQPTQETTSLDTGGTVGNPPGTSDSGPGTGLDSSSGDAESSSTGEPPTPLIDDGLLGRWYIDDAAAGTPPDQMLADSAPSPFDLLMVYVEDAPDFAMVDGNLGLRWLAAEQYGRPMAPVFNTKIHQTLGVSTAATFEIVVVIQDVSDASHG
ncbi:MAG: hypothetical protein K0V04_26980 [Deltaproteobacteria bacterium]|nr:hypothetical protein [Deltaproteobacteria bacterium]